MKSSRFTLEYTIYSNETELDKTYQQLIIAAREASFLAHAPYSQFRVGAAVLLNNNIIIKGNNQENASYPEGLCAERVAVFSAMANYPNENIKAIAISGNPIHFKLSQPLAPCGACRQVLLEYENKANNNIIIFMTSMEGEIWKFSSIKDLLPFTFSAKELNNNQ